MCLSGAIEVIRDDHTVVVEAGEILVVNPGEVHRCRFGLQDVRTEGLTLILRPEMFRSVWDAMTLPYGNSYDLSFSGKIRDSEVLRLSADLIDEIQEQRRGYAIVAEGLTRQILVQLLRVWPIDAIVPVRLSMPPQLAWVHMHRAVEYMNSHGKGAFRLSGLCNDVGVSPSRFIPLFKNSAGISPHSYYNSLLIYKARRLMHVKHCSTKDAAYTLGFKNVSHFCALFRQITGSTPQADQADIGLLQCPAFPEEN